METKPPALTARRRHWWQHWVFKIIAGGALALLLGIVASDIIERELGEGAWKKYQAEAAAKGTKLRLQDFVKAPIPEEQNYAAAPIFQKLFADPAGAKDQLVLPDLPRNKEKSAGSKHFDLKRWQKAFVASRWIPGEGSDSASDVLAALQRLEQPLLEIRQASSRPQSRWPVQWEKGIAATSPHLTFLQQASTAFDLKATAFLEQGKPDEVIQQLRYSIRAAESLNGEPTLLPALVRMAIWRQVMGVIEQGLVTNQWNDPQIVEISQELLKADFLSQLTFAFESERGMGNSVFDQAMAMGRIERAKSMQVLALGGRWSQTKFALFGRSSGWVRQGQIEYNRLIDMDLEGVDARNGVIDARLGRSSKVVAGYPSGVHVMTAMLLPNIEGAGSALAEEHALALQLRGLCAAIRYRGQYGEWPASLDSLVPEFLDKVPLDAMDAQPLRYRRTDAGGCVLWSVGMNRIDDGGNAGTPGQSRTKAPDWVVEMPPLKRSPATDR